ncbi:MAG: bacteriophage holin [Chloroflexi bacterium]|nr:bacteriophage holin [Chloroflexota bacterium]
MKLNIKGAAIAFAILWALSILCISLINLITTGTYGNEFIFVWASIYPGYDTTVTGMIIGVIWALFDGAVCGALLAWLYNRFAR